MVAAQLVLNITNGLLAGWTFPGTWKKGNAVLITKSSMVDGKVTYRPICLLDTLGMLYEILLREIFETQNR